MSSLTWILVTALLCRLTLSSAQDEVSLEIRMPPFEVEEEDMYLCTAMPLPEAAMKLKAFEPLSDQDTVHHMLLFGCMAPSSTEKVWECQHKPTCKDSETVLYGWGRNAEKLVLPDGVAYSVGKNTNIQMVVLQIHYLIQRPKGDESGLIIKLTNEASERTASMVMYAASFQIPPRLEKHPVENECCYSGFEPLTTVAFRVHTHEMGRNVYMTKKSGRSPYGDVIARRHPLLPQGFVSVEKQTTVFPGERLKATCDFNSTEKSEVVVAGFTHKDEMCNMYMMVHSEIPHFGLCADDIGFSIDENSNMFEDRSTFIREVELSDLWRGPDAASEAKIGEVVGVDRGHDGRIWTLHRGNNTMEGNFKPDAEGRYQVIDRSLVDTDTVLILDPTNGTTVTSWGANLFNVPHMLTIDVDGNVWITDVGLHQVFKFTSEGEPLMTLGEAFVPGNDDSHFCSPTQVAVLTDGSFLVSDGYCNSRVAKFSADGKFLADVALADVTLPHSLLADECQDLLYAANRVGSTIAVYKLSDLTRVGSLGMSGEVMALARGPFDSFLVMSTEDNTRANISQFRMTPSGIPLAESWEVPSVAYPHDIVLSAAPVQLTGSGNRLFALYIAEVQGMKLSKYILQPPSYETSQTNEEPQQTLTTDLQSSPELQVTQEQTEEPLGKTEEVHSEESITFHALTQTTTPETSNMRPFILFCSISVIAAAVYFLRKKRLKRSF